MSKKVQQQHKPLTATKKTTATSATGLLENINQWLEARDKKVFYTLLFLSTLFSLLLFDSKVTLGGDDSSYIERAWSFLNEGKFPYFQGPGYPVFLSLFVKMFGINVVALKFVSVFCQLGFVWVTYLTFRKRIPYLVLFALLAFISFNSFIQYYASQTFTETFFLFLQSICLYITFKIIDKIDKEDSWVDGFKNNYKQWLLFGFMFLILTVSKSIAFVTIAGVILYFLMNKNYKQVVYAIVAFLVFRVLYQLITTAAFGANETNQMEMMMRVDLYKPQGAHETFSTMIDRFFMNFNTYISWHMYRILNLRLITNLNVIDVDTIVPLPALSYISTIILGIFTFLSYKRNKFVFFSSIYLIVLIGGVFLGVQANNMQSRLIIIAMPLIFLVLFYGVYELVKRSSMMQFFFILFSVIMLIITMGKSVVTAKQNFVALKKNMAGDMYYGYTPDWENFLKMSKYCADSLPDSTNVLSRKPAMSFIYGHGKKFIGQFDSPSAPNADSVLNGWHKNNVQYIILASLRQNPKKNNGHVINNIHRMLQPIVQQYPQKLRLVKSIGTEEVCELYQINY